MGGALIEKWFTNSWNSLCVYSSFFLSRTLHIFNLSGPNWNWIRCEGRVETARREGWAINNCARMECWNFKTEPNVSLALAVLLQCSEPCHSFPMSSRQSACPDIPTPFHICGTTKKTIRSWPLEFVFA